MLMVPGEADWKNLTPKTGRKRASNANIVSLGFKEDVITPLPMECHPSAVKLNLIFLLMSP